MLVFPSGKFLEWIQIRSGYWKVEKTFLSAKIGRRLHLVDLSLEDRIQDFGTVGRKGRSHKKYWSTQEIWIYFLVSHFGTGKIKAPLLLLQSFYTPWQI